MTYRIYAHYDQDASRPDLYGGTIDLVSYSNRHTNFVHPDDVRDDDVITTLSYYEHGACKWMVGESTVPDYGGFDTVQVAGVLVWNKYATDSERADFKALPEDQRRGILDSIVEEYTAWANGEVYGYRLVRLNGCDGCGQTSEEEIDSCWGHIGSEWFVEAVKETLLDNRVNQDEVEVAGEAQYVLEYGGIGK